jgi:DNA recombination protein RmuC
MDIWTFIAGLLIGAVLIIVYNKKNSLSEIDEVKKELKEQFKNISNEILQKQADAIANKASETVSTTNKLIIDPLKTQLDNIKADFNKIETNRLTSHTSLDEKLTNLSELHSTLNETTTDLKNALSGNTTTGTWGNQKLKNIVEMAGMTENVDFGMEKYADKLDERDEGNKKKKKRIDGLIKLSEGGKIPIDAKTSLTAFLQISETEDEEEKNDLLKLHSSNVKKHIDDLIEREYHTLFENSVPYTIMFMPHEPALNAAFNYEPSLFEYALQNNIVITAPASMYSLLQVIARGWSQLTLDKNQEKIMKLAEDLYDSAVTFTDHYLKLGGKINDTVSEYNNSVGSFDKTFKNSRKKLIDYGVDSAKVKSVKNDVEKLQGQDNEAIEVREPKEFRD